MSQCSTFRCLLHDGLLITIELVINPRHTARLQVVEEPVPSEPEAPKQDVQTVTPEGVPIHRLIHGVVIRPAVTHTDDRGTLWDLVAYIGSLDRSAHRPRAR